MSKISNKNILLALICISNAYGEYSSPEITVKKAEIRQIFIGQKTVFVIEAKKKGKPIEKVFEKFLKKDPLMDQIEKVRHEGRDNASLSANQFFQDVEQDFEEEGNKLNDQLLSAQRNKVFSQQATAIGVILFAVGMATKQPIAIGAGMILACGSGYGWHYNQQKVNAIPVHIKAIHTMETDWKRTFKAVKKDK